MIIRLVKIALAALVGVWGVWGGIHNLLGYSAGLDELVGVISMRDVPAPKIFAVTNPLFAHLFFAGMWGAKLIGGALCLKGAFDLWRARKRSPEGFHAARTWAIAGCAVLFIMLMAGFNLVAAGVFMAFMTPAIQAIELSWVFAGEIGIVMLFLNMRD